MITHVRIQNFRSFLDAEVDLEPFSLVLGANGSGKTNLLRFFEVVSQNRWPEHMLGVRSLPDSYVRWKNHLNYDHEKAAFEVQFEDGPNYYFKWEGETPDFGGEIRSIGLPIRIFNIDAEVVTGVESVKPNANVHAIGNGTTQVLDMLKNGDREDLFDRIEASFMRYVPEVEKLSLRTVKEGFKQIQVREKGLNEPTPGPELSEGTRLILAMLTIIHQEKPPPIILLEDIDRGMHPRLFEYVAPMMRDMAVQHGINILATTHNPYLVDAFQDNKKAVIIVEKKDGVSTLTTLDKKLDGLNYEEVNPEDMPLGALWYSGIVGGTPAKIGHGAGV
jgi:predicted ATPase